MFAVWDGGKVAFKSDAVYDTYTVKCLPILTFAAGDLAYLMLLALRTRRPCLTQTLFLPVSSDWKWPKLAES
jgi:hypothetical protein